MADEVAQTVGDRPQQPFLLPEEGPLVGLRCLAGVADADFAPLLALDENVSSQRPGGFHKPGKVVRIGTDDDLRAARLRILPARGNRLGDLAEDLAARRITPGENLFDTVKAFEFLLPLAVKADQVVGRVFRFHRSEVGS